MSSKNKITFSFDFRSIRFKLWTYLVGFAFLLILSIWVLQLFFLNNYYEAMKISETNRIAAQLKASYSAKHGIDGMIDEINSLAFRNDVIIFIESRNGNLLWSQEYLGHGRDSSYVFEKENLRNKLSPKKREAVSILSEGGSRNRVLGYATFLNDPLNFSKEVNPQEKEYILYIFSPLFPVESTVSILRVQFMYITIISVAIALCLAMYLSARISKPIKNINSAATEMGNGNYNAKFSGGNFTELIELADTLTTASHELEKTNMYQKDLIANVSHDLKTPLTMIKSYAEMIRDLSGDNPKKRSEHLNVIIEEADRLNLLVGDMLSMTRMQSKKIQLEKTYFDICKTAKSLFSSYEILSEQEGYKFTFSCNQSAIVHGDEAKIKQVLSNLINNAVKYCGEDKEIIISIKSNGKKVVCKVSDHGAGIAPDEINHVWERYYKSSTHHVRATDGSGLGLSIVKEIMVLHKCNYGVESKLGVGSTFWFEMDEINPKIIQKRNHKSLDLQQENTSDKPDK